MNTATLLRTDAVDTRANNSVDIAVWLVIAVSTCLFTLFVVIYAIRMNGAGWTPVALPPQLWLATGWLMVAGRLLQSATRAARREQWPRCQALWLAGGASTALFVATQLWAWQSLHNAQQLPQGATAAGLFYLLTGMHGLHVLGGLLAWAAVAPAGEPSASRAGAWQLALCVRYWHFLLAVWLALFAVLGGLTPF